MALLGLHVEAVTRERGHVRRYLGHDGAHFPGKGQGDRERPVVIGRVPVHLRQAEDLVSSGLKMTHQ